MHAHAAPDGTEPCILLTDESSHRFFKTTPHGYVQHRFPYDRSRTDDYKRGIIDALVEHGRCLSEVDVALVSAALADPTTPRRIPWRFLWYKDKLLLKFAALRCCVPLFERVERGIQNQADANMVQLLLVSGLHDHNTEDFVAIMRRQRFDIIDWTVDIADRYGFNDVVAELQRLKRLKIR